MARADVRLALELADARSCSEGLKRSMRPGQNRRVRGRNRTKGPNPLTRAYESNGPDVKIRGTAQHVADKYAQLARDAQAGGDPVAAENYLQHAEHYYRMIAAAQEALRQQYGGGPRAFDEDGEDGEEDGVGPGYGPGGDRSQQSGPDEFGDGGNYQGGYDNRPPERPPQQRFDRNDRPQNRNGPQQRFDRGGGYDRPQGGERYDRPNGERYDRGGNVGERFGGNGQQAGQGQPGGGNQGQGHYPGDRNDRSNGPRDRYPPRGGDGAPRNDYQGQPREPRGEFAGQPREPRPDRQPPPFRPEPRFAPAEEPDPSANLPAFLTNPVRAPIAAEPELSPAVSGAPFAAEGSDAESAAFPTTRAPRRRRTRKPDADGGADSDAPGGVESAAE